jgi:hypothetical protein
MAEGTMALRGLQEKSPDAGQLQEMIGSGPAAGDGVEQRRRLGGTPRR